MDEPVSQPEEQNWWDRNWKWFVPVAVLSALVAIAAFVFAILSFVYGMMKTSDAYLHALARARENPAVTSALGSPITEGYWTSGSINVSGPSGNADLAIPISGPKGEGTIFLSARKSAGEWTYSVLVVQVAQSKERINLLGETRK